MDNGLAAKPNGGVMEKLHQIQNKLRDERSGKVIFLCHCLLNMNARYLGGAFRSSCVTEIVQGAIEREIGIVQMKCPEQYAWGGILKPLMWMAFESRNTLLYQMRMLFLPLFLLYTRLRYQKTAKEVLREILDYEKAGYEIIGIIGIDGSPSCGVNLRIDVKTAYDLYAAGLIRDLTRKDFNQSLYSKCLAEGNGIFIGEIKKGLNRRGKEIPFYSHSLLDEKDRKKTQFGR